MSVQVHRWPTRVGMLVMGEAVHVWGRRVCGKFLYLPLKFSVNLKLLFERFFLKSVFKMGEGLDQTFLQRRYTSGQQALEKVLNIISRQGNANQNHNAVPPHTHYGGCKNVFTRNKCWEGCEEIEILVNSCWECKMVQLLFHPSVETQKNWKQVLEQKFAQEQSQQHCSQQTKGRNNPNVCRVMNG